MTALLGLILWLSPTWPVQAAPKIVTAEDFVEKAATRSSLSGRAYKVWCPYGGSEVTSDQWLQDALATYR